MKTIITLIKTLLLSHFPSGSAINYHDGRLYIIGDDANELLILDNNYNHVTAIKVFNYKHKRIPKAQKPDLETSVILDKSGQQHLLALGSAATKERETAILFNLPPDKHKPHQISYTPFINRLKALPEINIEGAAVTGKYFILSNRGNETNPINHFIITTPDFLEQQETAPINIVKLTTPAVIQGFAGVSELCYAEKEDILFITLSSEATGNAYDDGAIGDSYLGWIYDISKKITDPEISLDGVVNLSESDPAFKGEKVEGVCISGRSDNGWILDLVADNDKGASRLFRVKVVLDNFPKK